MLGEPGRTLSPNDYLLVYDLLDIFNGRRNAEALRSFLANFLAFGAARRHSITETYLDAIVPCQNR